ncbi:unnamed protein product, partial [Rotaria sp. Silwood1]
MLFYVSSSSLTAINEFVVVKPLLGSKTVNDVIQFLDELIPMSNAFPETLRMIKNTITLSMATNYLICKMDESTSKK